MKMKEMAMLELEQRKWQRTRRRKQKCLDGIFIIYIVIQMLFRIVDGHAQINRMKQVN